jgi:hypothetical protein
MEGYMTLTAIVAAWLVLGLFASGQGIDSRDTLPDDHRR